MLRLFLFLVSTFTLGVYQLSAQCDTTLINKAAWTVAYFDSEEAAGEGANNGHAIHCIDGDLSTFWHTQWQGAQPGFPHEIQIDLGATYPVNGFDIVTRASNAFGKVGDYIFSTSLDGTNWIVQDSGVFVYPLNNATQETIGIRFGAVDAQFIRVQALNSSTNNYYVCLAEINAYQDLGCGATGQTNQQVVIDPVPSKNSTDLPFNVNAISSSGLPITYSIISGPATVLGNQVTLTGAGGYVTVRATQVGDATYYADFAETTFEVVNSASYIPVVNTKLTESYPIQMPQLYAYKLYANASIAHPELLTITGMEFEIDGTTIPATLVNGAYEAWWTPNAYGNHTVIIKATGSNGNVGDSTLTINVVSTATDQTATTFNGNIINFDGSGASQWTYGTYTLPQSVGIYDSIQAKFYVTCPSVAGGCDDWDRVAWVQYKAPDGDWHELFRYVTPYGKACNHSIDVTDYESLLQGNIEIRMYIETWGSGGWKLDLDFEYFNGTPDYLYSTIDEVWHGTYNFGQMTNLQPVPVEQITFPNGTEKSTFRLNTSGHGWGENNSGNAAEFYNATHDLLIDDVETFQQNLWTDCNPNPDGCTGQAGTWQYDRAGWCPGTIAKPYKYDLTPYLNNAPFDFKYRFQESYIDYCNPANPNCVSGSTCTDCNAGYNPHYVVSGYQINFSNQPITAKIEELVKNDDEFKFSVYPNPTSDVSRIFLENEAQNIVVNVYGIDGLVVKTFFFKTTSELNAYQFDFSSLAAGSYFVKVRNVNSFGVKKIIVQ